MYPENGTEKELYMQINSKIETVIPITSSNIEKLFLLIDNSDKVYVYPDTSEAKLAIENIIKKLSLCHIGRSKTLITGYKINPKTMTAVESWRINFDKTGEEIIAYDSDDQLTPEEYQPLEENNGNILYKYIDSNLMAVATFSQSNDLNIYIIKRNTGSIIYVGHVYSINGKENVKISFSENTIMINYLKKYEERSTTVLNEVLVIKMYYPTIESDVKNMISQYYDKGIQIGNEDSNKLPMPKFLTQTFVLSAPMKELILTKTRQGITNKHAIFLTTNNKIVSVPELWLEARRPTNNPNREGADFEDIEMKPYDAVIPIIYSTSMNYDLALNGITSILTIPQEYESTTLVVASGLDLFVSRFAPEKVM